jgi:hypothetical protein
MEFKDKQGKGGAAPEGDTPCASIFNTTPLIYEPGKYTARFLWQDFGTSVASGRAEIAMTSGYAPFYDILPAVWFILDTPLKSELGYFSKAAFNCTFDPE